MRGEVCDFNPRSPHGERPAHIGDGEIQTAFQPTLPARGATRRSPRERKRRLFQPTLPARGATSSVSAASFPNALFQPTLPARGATDLHPRRRHGSRHFNPRSPHGERLDTATGSVCVETFQPTLPARGATISGSWSAAGGSDFNPRSPHGERRPRPGRRTAPCHHFNPRSPHGERRDRAEGIVARRRISTHAPRTGSDKPASWSCISTSRFQPTLPARGATHASGFCLAIPSNFNPRSPHGERRFFR